jgi:hypothetical protein
MPPVNMRVLRNRFVPDYATILLAKKLVMDEESYDALVGNPHSVYAEVAEAFKELKTAGFVELTNFSGSACEERRTAVGDAGKRPAVHRLLGGTA